MNKEEILKEIKKIEEHLATMKKLLKDCEYSRWNPKPSQEYFCVDDGNDVRCVIFNTMNAYDRDRIKTYNCFRTKEQAEQEAEKILVRRMLEDIARRLNKGQKIDWSDKEQTKYSIGLDAIDNEIIWDKEARFISQGMVYCLDMNFYNVAIQEIGEERLKKYLRGE